MKKTADHSERRSRGPLVLAHRTRGRRAIRMNSKFTGVMSSGQASVKLPNDEMNIVPCPIRPASNSYRIINNLIHHLTHPEARRDTSLRTAERAPLLSGCSRHPLPGLTRHCVVQRNDLFGRMGCQLQPLTQPSSLSRCRSLLWTPRQDRPQRLPDRLTCRWISSHLRNPPVDM